MRGILARCLLTAALLASGLRVGAQETNTGGANGQAERQNVSAWEVAGATFQTGIATTAIEAAMDPETALLHASLLTRRLHGNVGEALVNSQLHSTGGWKSIPARNGPQGIDHIWMKFDKAGRPVGLIVGETKYGAGRLGMTKHNGRQMSQAWRSSRLAARAEELEREAEVVTRKYGEGKAKPFHVQARCLRGAAEGRIAYRSELFRVNIKGDMLSISVQNLDSNGNPVGASRRLPPVKIAGRPANVVKAQLAGELRKQYPAMSAQESLERANRLYTGAKSAQAALSAKSPALRLAGATGATLAAGGLLAGGLDVLFQRMSHQPVSWTRAGKMAGLGAGSAFAGEATQLAVSQMLMRSQAARAMTVTLGRSMGLLPARTVAIAPKLAGGVVGAVVFAYGGYAMGMYDLRTANQFAIAGAAGSLAGSATGAGMMAAAAAWGTASTGTAISTLSGAAAQSATLAWWGGGAAAATGTGTAMTWGAVIVGGVAVVAALAVTAGAMWGFHHYDTVQEWARLGRDVDFIRNLPDNHPGNPWTASAAM
jgi:hypothetical protein